MAYAEPQDPGEDRIEPGKELSPEVANLTDRMARQEAAIFLKMKGYTYTQIAKHLNYASANHARLSVERGLAASVGPDEKAQARFLNGRRLERILRGVWKKATNPESEEHLPAARVALALIDRHIRLYGADAPSEMVIYNPGQTEIDQWLKEATKHVREATPDEVDIIDAEIVEGEAGIPDEDDDAD